MTRHEASVRDFAIIIEDGTYGPTVQIEYNGTLCAGMSGFGGSMRWAADDLSDVLRRLANDVTALAKSERNPSCDSNGL